MKSIRKVSIPRSSRLSIAFALNLLAVASLVVVMTSGFITPRGKVDCLSFAVIDSSKVETKVGTNTFKGLPDAHDFSRYKDFYTFHLWNYCSGNIENGTYRVNFCSTPKQSLFDLFGFWKVWGASVEKADVRFSWLQRGPKLLNIAYIVTASFVGLATLVGGYSRFTKRTNRLLCALSTFGTLAFVTTAILAQVTYGQLVRRADDEDIAITARHITGIVYIITWAGVVLSLAATGLWWHIHMTTTVKRAPTMDPRAVAAISTSIQSPIEYQRLQTPVRQRTFGNWPRDEQQRGNTRDEREKQRLVELDGE